MICRPCRDEADFPEEAQQTRADYPNEVLGHDACKRGSWCDCQNPRHTESR